MTAFGIGVFSNNSVFFASSIKITSPFPPLRITGARTPGLPAARMRPCRFAFILFSVVFRSAEAVENQLAAAVDPRVVAERCEREAYIAVRIKRVFQKSLPDALEQRRPGAGNAAADHDGFGVADRAARREEKAERVVHGLERRFRRSIPGGRAVEHRLRRQLVHVAHRAHRIGVRVEILLCNADDAGRRGVLLHAAVPAAGAGLRLVPVDDHVAELAARAVRAGDQLAVRDHGAAHARAERDEQHILAALAAAHPILAERRDVGVVRAFNREPGDPRQRLAHVENAPAEVDAAVHRAVRRDGAGDARADAEHIRTVDTAPRHAVFDSRGDVAQHRFPLVLDHRRDLPFFEKRAIRLEQAELHGRAADVRAEYILHFSFHLLFLIAAFHPALFSSASVCSASAQDAPKARIDGYRSPRASRTAFSAAR